MAQLSSRRHDVDLTRHDIQGIGDADGLVSLFARLGYDTNTRTQQSPSNLGITAEGTLRPIRKVEMLADREGLFQVYVFEVESVSVTHTRALARAFRNRAGNYLLVLTSDYEQIDFVLIERFLPDVSGKSSGPAAPLVGVRPRVLTVDRRNPGSVALRVLRRFTWTEQDPLAQYDKLLSAYGVADWSEGHFNNRALFSDYYLLQRLQERPDWKEDPKPVYRDLRELYAAAAARCAAKDKATLRKDVVDPVLRLLGFVVETGKKSSGDSAQPDYLLRASDAGSAPLASCLIYPWGRDLDRKDDAHDAETPEENPGAVVVSLLEKGSTPWVILTNGKLWRLYAREAHSRATNYYEIDLAETLAQPVPAASDPGESFRYFWILFRRQAFEPVETERDGRKQRLCLLDRLLLESEDYAKALGESLKARVFEHVFPCLAKGFIAHLRSRGGKEDLPEETLDAVFQGTLTLLYRLLFLMYAEARDLLPQREVRGYFDASLTKIKKEAAEIAGPIADEIEARLRPRYREDGHEIYNRLTRLFRAVDKGDSALNVPTYNGGLYLSDPDDEDDTPEAHAARFLNRHKVPDRFLARALDLLARDEDPKRHELVSIDYKSLGVRHLGSIYEGLLEFKVRIADRKLGVTRDKGREVYAPFAELDEKARKRAEHEGRTIQKGEPYLLNDKGERKATGSYYTPDHIVKYIVEKAVGPVLAEKFDALRPKFREAAQGRRAFFQQQEAFRKKGLKPKPDAQADAIGKELADEFFNIKVLDPAMGSGHFLVEAVDFITDKAIDFLNSFPWNPVTAHLARTREAILHEMEEQGITIDPRRLTDVNLLKRHVLKRCIYGVDLNPMAVELAKVSLWLDCFTLGAPLSFLDHHLRCGNSLVGVTVKEARDAMECARPGEHPMDDLFGSRFAGLLLATDLMRRVGNLSDITSAQVKESRSEYRKASDALLPFKRVLDVYTSRWFGNSLAAEAKRKGKRGKPGDSPAVAFLKAGEAERFLNAHGEKAVKQALTGMSPDYRRIADTARSAATGKRFFHWELEFPEVFYGPRPGSRQAVERLEGAGFDAVIGNPPYDVLAEKELGRNLSDDLGFFQESEALAPAIRGKTNLYKLFICRGASVAKPEGTFSFIVPMALLGDEQSAGVRRMLLNKMRLFAVETFPQKDDPYKRIFPEAKLSTCAFVAGGGGDKSRFTVRTHPGKHLEGAASVLQVAPDEIFKFDSANATIPSCSQRDWDIALKIIANPSMKRLSDYVRAFQGEVNETTDGGRGFISTNPKDGPMVLRGASICLYAVRDASQGEAIYLRKQKYLKGKPDSEKARHHEQERVGWQESSAQNNFRRIIAAIIPPSNFCNHKINYIPAGSSQIPSALVLAILNSKLADWLFRLTSTNAAVSHYQIYSLPVPTFTASDHDDVPKPLKAPTAATPALLLKNFRAVSGTVPKSIADAIVELSRRISAVEAKRVLKSRSERSHLSPESQPLQDVIDAVLFRCYGLTDEEADYVRGRLKEML